MFWNRKKKFKEYILCFQIEENLNEVLATRDSDFLSRFESAFPPLGALPAKFDVNANEFCVTVTREDLTVQELLAVFTQLGLHAKLKEGS